MTSLPSIDLQPLVGTSPSAIESRLIDIFGAAVNALSPTELSAESTAGELDKLYPAGKGGEGAEDFLWTFWTLFIAVAKSVPADDPRQKTLAQTVQKLKAKKRESIEIWGSQTSVWSDLPLFGAVAREAWNARPEFTSSEPDAKAIAQWISLNSFAARLLGTSSVHWTNFAIWELRDALEEELPASPAALDANIATASEWLTHAGKVLRDEGRSARKLDEADAKALSIGSLVKEAPSGLSDARWKFWVQRLGALSAKSGNAKLKDRVADALVAIKGL